MAAGSPTWNDGTASFSDIREEMRDCRSTLHLSFESNSLELCGKHAHDLDMFLSHSRVKQIRLVYPGSGVVGPPLSSSSRERFGLTFEPLVASLITRSDSNSDAFVFEILHADALLRMSHRQSVNAVLITLLLFDDFENCCNACNHEQ